MTHPKVLTKLSLSVLFMLTVFLLSPAKGIAQSRDPDSPTAVTGFPVTGNLGTGTYYYEVPESIVTEGDKNATLTFTPPPGGGSMTASFSGRRCCSGDATVGESTGYAETIRRSTTFNVPGPQNLLITVYISVAPKYTVRFSLNLSVTGAPSGIIVTPPPTPTPPSTTSTGGVCTDLSVDYYQVEGVGLTRGITGVVRNRTTTHPYKGFPRGQWIEIFDITDSEKAATRITFIRLPDIIDPGDSFSYRAQHTLTTLRRTRYMIKIVYSPGHATDRSQYNDDCNDANNITRRQLLGEAPLEVEPVPLRP